MSPSYVAPNVRQVFVLPNTPSWCVPNSFFTKERGRKEGGRKNLVLMSSFKRERMKTRMISPQIWEERNEKERNNN